jgi:membrane fusion protein (multidrug efflux system)
MSRPSALSLAFITVAALLAGACKKQEAPAAGSGAPQVGVVVLQSQRVAITTELPGRTAATLVAEVRPQVTGIIQSRNFAEGGEVKQGAVLYKIDPATYQAQFDSARAALVKAEANLQTARLKAQRYKELVAIKAVSQQEADDAAAALLQGEAEVAGARAAVQAARINLGYTAVTAPISGRIGKSAVTPGALVTANQATPLATIQKLDPVYVDVTQSSGAMLRLRRAFASGSLQKTSENAARVKLLFEDGSEYPLEGQLQFTDVTVDPSTGAITLRALFPNPKGELMPGMYVRAVVEEGVRENAITVPQQAVIRDTKGEAMALVVVADGKVESRRLQAPRTLGDQWLVDEGLKAGDRVIVDNLQRVRPGSVVQPVERVLTATPASTPPAPAAAPAAGTNSSSGAGPATAPATKSPQS